MKTQRMTQGFTLIELLVVISIIAILATLATPVFNVAIGKAKEIQNLNNVKQVGTALQLYASDYDGVFPPSSDGQGGSYSSSNEALAVMVDQGSTGGSEKIFFIAGSKWCNPNPPDEKLTADGGQTLAQGECGLTYIADMTNTDKASTPLVAQAAQPGSPGVYSTDTGVKGGVPTPTAAVVFIDGSAQRYKLKKNGTDYTAENASGDNIFDQSQLPTGATPLDPL